MKKYTKCINCENPVYVTKSSTQKFCSHKCHRDFNKNVSFIGIKFNYLEVINDIEPKFDTKNNPIRMVECECVCGNKIKIAFTKIKNGLRKSCGCVRKKLVSKLSQQLNYEGNILKHPLYAAWLNMRQRCFNPNNKNWRFYGKRGVKICDEWNQDFKCFYNWAILNGWQKGLHLDKDMKGDGFLYSPSTCSFITKSENSTKTRKVRYIKYKGNEKSLSDLSKEFNLPRYVIIKRVKLGWNLDDVFNTPVLTKYSHGKRNI